MRKHTHSLCRLVWGLLFLSKVRDSASEKVPAVSSEQQKCRDRLKTILKGYILHLEVKQTLFILDFYLLLFISIATATTRRCICTWWTLWAPSSVRGILYHRSCWTLCWSTWCPHTRYVHNMHRCPVAQKQNTFIQTHTCLVPPWMLIDVEPTQWGTV